MASRALACRRPERRISSTGGRGGGPRAPRRTTARATAARVSGPTCTPGPRSGSADAFRRARPSRRSPSISTSPETYARANPSSFGAHTSRRSARGDLKRTTRSASSGPVELPSQQSRRTGSSVPIAESTRGARAMAAFIPTSKDPLRKVPPPPTERRLRCTSPAASPVAASRRSCNQANGPASDGMAGTRRVTYVVLRPGGPYMPPPRSIIRGGSESRRTRYPHRTHSRMSAPSRRNRCHLCPLNLHSRREAFMAAVFSPQGEMSTASVDPPDVHPLALA